MVYIRVKEIRNKSYYYLVEGKKDAKGRVKQKVLYYVGDKEALVKLFEAIQKRLH